MWRPLLLAAVLVSMAPAQAWAGEPPERQAVAGAQVAEAARHYLLRRLQTVAGEVDVKVASVPADVTVPPGTPVLRVRELGALPLRSRMVLWVDVVSDGGYSRPVPVPLALQVLQRVMVASRDLGAGELAGTDDVAVQVRDVVALGGASAPPFESGVQARLRKDVAAGAVVLQADLLSSAGVLRGDRVRLLAGAGGMSVESAALALSDGEPGQRVMVRPVQGQAAVRARVAGAGIVRLED